MVELSTADEANVQGNEAFANQRIDDAIEVLMPPSADSCPHSDPKMDPPLHPSSSSSLERGSVRLPTLPNCTCVLLDALPLKPHDSICCAARTAVHGWIASQVASGRKATSCHLVEQKLSIGSQGALVACPGRCRRVHSPQASLGQGICVQVGVVDATKPSLPNLMRAVCILMGSSISPEQCRCRVD
jgi:hypothetical protein